MTLAQSDTVDTISLCADAQTLGQRIVAALPVMYARRVSLHDATGTTHWRSAPQPEPAELIAVRTALESFIGPAAPARVDQPLPDGSAAVLLRSVNANNEFSGFVMLQIDARRLRGKGRAAPDLPIPVLRAAREWGYFAARSSPKMPADRSNDLSDAEAAELLKSYGPNGAAEDNDPVLQRYEAQLREFPIALFAQRLIPLQPDCRIRRFEVLLRRDAPETENCAPQ
ncbi:MAG: hypothetical protein RML32_01240, partial [Gammaproteobacteria bacterium]|nr:hypothetical protein [Gammaproteobacteria bacterium]